MHFRSPRFHSLMLLLTLSTCTGSALGAQIHGIQNEWEQLILPMDHSSGYLEVEVMVNGKGPFRFQLDTYASIEACVDDDFAHALNLPKIGTIRNSDGHRFQEKDLVRIDGLEFGGAHFAAVRTLVDDYDWIDEGGRKIDGLLGFPLFRDLLLTIDYPKSRIILGRGRLKAKDAHCIPFTTPTGSPDIMLML